MHQYSFTATSRRDNARVSIRATARTPAVALWHVRNYYGDAFNVNPEPERVDPPHYFLGEIDCTSAGAEEIAAVR